MRQLPVAMILAATVGVVAPSAQAQTLVMRMGPPSHGQAFATGRHSVAGPTLRSYSQTGARRSVSSSRVYAGGFGGVRVGRPYGGGSLYGRRAWGSGYPTPAPSYRAIRQYTPPPYYGSPIYPSSYGSYGNGYPSAQGYSSYSSPNYAPASAYPYQAPAYGSAYPPYNAGTAFYGYSGGVGNSPGPEGVPAGCACW